MSTIDPSSRPTRLGFIDLARAVAILLMLEGHFVDITLAPEWRNEDSAWYSLWHHLRGLAAPMFFTVTGIIFAYLLQGSREPGFWKKRRVRRGLRRAGELLFWGYLLQINLTWIPRVIENGPTARMSAFHVLQCIAAGLLVIIALHGLATRMSRPALVILHAVGGFSLFAASILLANHEGFVPAHAPVGIQNIIKGPVGPFPVAPWLGFTLYGAAIGIALRANAGISGRLVGGFLAAGLLLSFGGWAFDHTFGKTWLEITGNATENPALPTMFHGRFGQILLLLGVLMWIERRFSEVPEWLRTIGRNTFPIYVGHVIVLYGGLFGIGLDDWLRDSLNPWQAALGATLFCACFGYLVQWTEPMAVRWRDWRLASSAS